MGLRTMPSNICSLDAAQLPPMNEEESSDSENNAWLFAGGDHKQKRPGSKAELQQTCSKLRRAFLSVAFLFFIGVLQEAIEVDGSLTMETTDGHPRDRQFLPSIGSYSGYTADSAKRTVAESSQLEATFDKKRLLQEQDRLFQQLRSRDRRPLMGHRRNQQDRENEQSTYPLTPHRRPEVNGRLPSIPQIDMERLYDAFRSHFEQELVQARQEGAAVERDVLDEAANSLWETGRQGEMELQSPEPEDTVQAERLQDEPEEAHLAGWSRSGAGPPVRLELDASLSEKQKLKRERREWEQLEREAAEQLLREIRASDRARQWQDPRQHRVQEGLGGTERPSIVREAGLEQELRQREHQTLELITKALREAETLEEMEKAMKRLSHQVLQQEKPNHQVDRQDIYRRLPKPVSREALAETSERHRLPPTVPDHPRYERLRQGPEEPWQAGGALPAAPSSSTLVLRDRQSHIELRPPSVRQQTQPGTQTDALRTFATTVPRERQSQVEYRPPPVQRQVQPASPNPSDGIAYSSTPPTQGRSRTVVNRTSNAPHEVIPQSSISSRSVQDRGRGYSERTSSFSPGEPFTPRSTSRSAGASPMAYDQLNNRISATLGAYREGYDRRLAGRSAKQFVPEITQGGTGFGSGAAMEESDGERLLFPLKTRPQAQLSTGNFSSFSPSEPRPPNARLEQSIFKSSPTQGIALMTVAPPEKTEVSHEVLDESHETAKLGTTSDLARAARLLDDEEQATGKTRQEPRGGDVQDFEDSSRDASVLPQPFDWDDHVNKEWAKFSAGDMGEQDASADETAESGTRSDSASGARLLDDEELATGETRQEPRGDDVPYFEGSGRDATALPQPFDWDDQVNKEWAKFSAGDMGEQDASAPCFAFPNTTDLTAAQTSFHNNVRRTKEDNPGSPFRDLAGLRNRTNFRSAGSDESGHSAVNDFSVLQFETSSSRPPPAQPQAPWPGLLRPRTSGSISSSSGRYQNSDGSDYPNTPYRTYMNSPDPFSSPYSTHSYLEDYGKRFSNRYYHDIQPRNALSWREFVRRREEKKAMEKRKQEEANEPTLGVIDTAPGESVGIIQTIRSGLRPSTSSSYPNTSPTVLRRRPYSSPTGVSSRVQTSTGSLRTRVSFTPYSSIAAARTGSVIVH